MLAGIAAAIGFVFDGKAARAVPQDARAPDTLDAIQSEAEAAVKQRLVALRARASALELDLEQDKESGEKRSVIAQWYNWPNWPNYWNDWRNWPNFRWFNY